VFEVVKEVEFYSSAYLLLGARCRPHTSFHLTISLSTHFPISFPSENYEPLNQVQGDIYSKFLMNRVMLNLVQHLVFKNVVTFRIGTISPIRKAV